MSLYPIGARARENYSEMKILMLNYEYPPLGGGAAYETYYLLKEFSKIENIKIDLITSSPTNENIEDRLNDLIHIYRLPVNKKRIHYWAEKEIISYSYRTYKYITNIRKQNKYDLIHAFFGIPCGAIAYLFRKEIPYIISLQGSDVPGFNERLSFQYIYLKPLIRLIWRNASAVIANSQGLKELALRTDKGSNIGVIYNGIDTDEFSTRERARYEDRAIIIITVARLIKRKGVDNLIQAVPDIVKNNQNVKIRIIGEGLEENRLKILARKLNVSRYLDFLGYVPHNELPNHYSSSDIFVLLSKNEGMSNSMLEAISSGLPIVCTDVGGVEELIKGNGIVVNPESPFQIAEALLELIENKDKRLEMGKISREIAEKNSWKSVAQKYLEAYQKVITVPKIFREIA